MSSQSSEEMGNKIGTNISQKHETNIVNTHIKKMPRIAKHWGNANKNYNDISPHLLERLSSKNKKQILMQMWRKSYPRHHHSRQFTDYCKN